MPGRPLLLITPLVVIFCLSAAFFILPIGRKSVFLSPDETAVATSARQFATKGTFAITDSIVREFSWIHPRSFVTQGGSIVPVGFLGMPLLMSIVWRLAGEYGLLFFTPLLAMSVLWPLWNFSKSFGRLGQVATLVGWVTFPTVILYANRGLFPNLVVVSLAMWSAWLLWSQRRSWKLMVAGTLFGLATLLRPLEVLLIIPWLILSATELTRSSQFSSGKRPYMRDAVCFAAPALLIFALGAILAWKTYGSPFLSGYQLRDPQIPLLTKEGLGEVYSWPFGFHPRNVWWNVRSYLLMYLAPWSAIAIGATILAFPSKKSRPWIFLAAWTGFVLLMLYGHGIYQDHVRAFNVSLANSFLRYLLPLAVGAAMALGWFSSYVANKIPRHGTALAVAFISLIGFFGIWTATVRDDEGLLQNRTELARYESIRLSAEKRFGASTVILSERSDKIFFPTFRAVSPMPSPERIRELAERFQVVVFIRTQDEEGFTAWANEGLRLKFQISAGNESLYRVLVADD